MKLSPAAGGKLFLIIFSTILILLAYKGIITPPSEGDSVDYHIPIAKSYLSGLILDPVMIPAPGHIRFYPSNTEGILALFILGKIPLGLFNVVAIFLLFTVCVVLAKKFKLPAHISIIFATSIVTLNGVLRWGDTQIIDIWLATFFLSAVIFLESIKPTLKHFLFLGIFLGFIIGAKYSGPFLAAGLVLVYIMPLIKNLSFFRFMAMMIPVILLGLSWYIRNVSLIGNPFYPQKILFFKGEEATIISTSVLTILTKSWHGFFGTINAILTEYLAWTVIVPICLILILKKKYRHRLMPYRLITSALLVTFFSLWLPSSQHTYIMVSSLRYFIIPGILLILFTFVFFERVKKIEYLIISALISVFFVEFPYGFFPKLLIIAVPIGLYLYFRGYGKLTGILSRIR